MINVRNKIKNDLLEYEKNSDKKIFKKDLNKSIYYLIENTVLIIILYYICYKVENNNCNKILNYFILIICLLTIGVLFWGQFVIGHDMGHQSFSNYKDLNRFLGVITHGNILVPFQQWRCSHRKHHKNTGHIDYDEIFKPIKKSNNFFEFISNNITIFPYVWLSYLFLGYPEDNNNHFDFNFVLAEDHVERKSNKYSTIYILFVLCFLTYLGKIFGYKKIAFYYFIPWTIFNYLIVMVTFLQHQNENINWKNDESGWSSDYGALQSVNRSYGQMFDYLSRNIGPYHQIHHLFPKIPHYNLKTAYFVFKNKYPELVNDAKGSGFIFQLKEYFKLSKKWKKNIILKNNKHNFYENFLGIKLSNQFN